MRVLILHDEVPPNAAPDAADALVQARLVADHLQRLAHTVRILPAKLDLTPVADAVRTADLVVNLVESLDGRGSLIHLVPALVESLGVPMTGCPAHAIAATSNKLTAKRALRDAAIPTPDWIDPHAAAPDAPPDRARWIIKSVWEHASIGLGPGSIIDAAPCDIPERIDSLRDALGGLAFAEAYIDGREFNLSILEIDGACTVLPPAEIQFIGFAPGRPRIVDYAAKWDESSYEYHHTPRAFDFPPEDRALLDELRRLALRCGEVFDLRGYARVDFRVDAQNRPWVLEVNTNPCLSPDAGFMAAADRAGLTPAAVIDHLVASALSRRTPPRHATL